MSSIPIATPVDVVAGDSTAEGQPFSFWERASDWWNPILVKECRQALKSKQFLICFLLMLFVCWLWTITSTLFLPGSGRPNASFGRMLLGGYLFILALPLTLIVPFGAYRSLVLEREDYTFELLSITTLKPWQIITGKIGSAALEMMLYVAGCAPCLAFTMLLSGVELATVGWTVFWLCLNSLTLICFGILCAAITKQRFWQMLMNVALLLFVVYILILTWVFLGEMVIEFGMNRMFREEGFDMASIGYILLNVTSQVVFTVISSACVTFASDNRATGIRTAMFVQHAVLWGWFLALCSIPYTGLLYESESWLVALFMSVLYWYVVGMFAVGEPDLLSVRVQRGLPQSFLGRMCCNWFYPGPGRGLLFAIGGFFGSFTIAMLAALLMQYWTESVPSGPARTFDWDHLWAFGIYGIGYLSIFLGIEALIMRYWQRSHQAGLVMRPLIQVLLLLTSILVSSLLLMNLSRLSTLYSWCEILNPFLAMGGVLYRSWQSDGLEYVVLLVGLVILLANIPGLLAEMRQTRSAIPARLLAELAAGRPPVVATPTNPWDLEDEN